MIYITGGSGFIGSNLIEYLGKDKCVNIDFKEDCYNQTQSINPYDFLNQEISENDMLVHLGACSDTTERNQEYLDKNNIQYSKNIINKFLVAKSKKIIFMSSMAVVGNNGLPMNQYAWSKKEIENWIIDNRLSVVVFRLTNCHGKNEDHKGMMASVYHKWSAKMKKNDEIQLFLNSDQIKRDFVPVEMVCEIIKYALYHQMNIDFIYDLGSGYQKTFKQVFDELSGQFFYKKEPIWIDVPEQIRDQYQVNTKASMDWWIRSKKFLDNRI